MDANPTFNVKAVGDFDQLPGVPAMSWKTWRGTCAEIMWRWCYNPSNERLPITRIEIVRIKPQISLTKKSVI